MHSHIENMWGSQHIYVFTKWTINLPWTVSTLGGTYVGLNYKIRHHQKIVGDSSVVEGLTQHNNFMGKCAWNWYSVMSTRGVGSKLANHKAKPIRRQLMVYLWCKTSPQSPRSSWDPSQHIFGQNFINTRHQTNRSKVLKRFSPLRNKVDKTFI